MKSTQAVQIRYMYFFNHIFKQVQGQSCHLLHCFIYLYSWRAERDTRERKMLQELVRGQKGQLWQTVCKDATYMNKLLHVAKLNLYRSCSHNCLVALPGCAHIYNSTYWKSDMLK